MDNNTFLITAEKFNNDFDYNKDEDIDFDYQISQFIVLYSYWKQYNYGDDNQELFGQALIRYSYALFNSSIHKIDKKRIIDLVDKTKEYQKVAPKNAHILLALYFNIGLGWVEVKKNKLAMLAFRQYIYYLFKQQCIKEYCNYSFYSFHPCSRHTIKSLKDGTLNISSPSVFNDIFDCPLLDIIKKDNTVAGKLLYKAYMSCLKVACFVRNKTISSLIKTDKEPKEEYLNTLMWAHYADSHKGICIKYIFPKIPLQNESQFECCSILNDVFYESSLDEKVMKPTKNGMGISTADAFFTKAEIWKYENEVRLININVKGKGLYEALPIYDAVKEIYFGANCSLKNIEKIKKAVSEKNVIFYRMVKDDILFGEIKRELL